MSLAPNVFVVGFTTVCVLFDAVSAVGTFEDPNN